MSIIDPESLMFSADWEEIYKDFIRRANEAGYYGVDVYSYVETYAYDMAIDRAVEQTAKELGFLAGQQIADLVN